jgi:hypothetical protein
MFIFLYVMFERIMPPLGGGLFQLILNHGSQDRMIMGDVFNRRWEEISLERRGRLLGMIGMNICTCCGLRTDNESSHYSDSVLCTSCRMIIVKLVIRAKGKFKQDFNGVNINIVNKNSIGGTISIGSQCPEEASTVAKELTKYMGFKHPGDIICIHRKYLQLISISEPVAYRNKFNDVPYSHTHIVHIHLDIKAMMNIETNNIENTTGLIGLAMSVVSHNPTTQKLLSLPYELIEPMFYSHPLLAVRFLEPEEN